MKNKNQDSEDIERAVYDGMQDLRTPRSNRGQSPISAKRNRKAPKRSPRRRGRA